MASRLRNKVDKNELNETVSDVLISLAKEPNMDTTGLLNYFNQSYQSGKQLPCQQLVSPTPPM